MQSPTVADDLAERQIGLIADDASAQAFITNASRKHKRKTWRESRSMFVFCKRLQTVVETHVCHAVVVFCEDVRNCVRELVRLTEDRPFLGKTWCDLLGAFGEIDRNS